MSLAIIKSDMALANDGPLSGASLAKGWAHAAVIAMGRDNRGVATPPYWTPANSELIGTARYDIGVPWFVIYRREGDDTQANVRVQARNLRVKVNRTSTGNWVDLGSTDNLLGGNYDADVINSYGAAVKRPASEGGGVEFLMPTGAANNVHGWGDPFSYNFADIAADFGCPFVSIQFRLVKDDPNGPDDLAAAKLVGAVGKDFYKGSHSISIFSPETYNPGSGGSRYKLITTEWQTFYYLPVDIDGAATRIETARSSTIALRMVTESWLDSHSPIPAGADPDEPVTVPAEPSSNWFPLADQNWDRLIEQLVETPVLDRIESNGPISAYQNDTEIVVTFTAYLTDESLASSVDVDTIASGSRAKIEGNSVILATEPSAQTDANGQLAVRLTPTGTPGGSTVTVSIGGMQASASVQVAGRDRPVSRYANVWGQPLSRPY